MYYPQNSAQWQQPPPPGASQPPGGLPHAAQAAPMSAEAAEAFRNYGYGSVPQRGGAGGQANRPGAHGKGRNAHQPVGNHQYGRGGQPGQHNPHAPMSANLPYSPTQAASPAGQMAPGMPYAGGNAPPAKRARYDSNAASSPGLPPHPGYPASLPPNPTHAGNIAQQHYQPMAHQQQQYQTPLPQGPPPQGPALPMSMPPQQQYYQPQQQQPQLQIQQYQQPMAGYQPVQAGFQYQPQLHQPMSQPQHQPYQSQVRHANNAQPGPPLAVAPMKATPMAAVNRHKNKPSGSSHHHQPPPPPPPASAVPPPPPPPPAEAPVAGPSRPSGTIRLSPKGAASLPPIPTGAASLPPNPTMAAAAASSSLPAAPTGPAIPTGPRGAGFKRDTRPLPSQSRQAESSLRGDGPSGSKHAGPAFRGKPPTGPAARGRGRGSSTRSAFDGGRSSGSRPAPRRDERFEQPSSSKGYKRTFSQTGPPPTGPRGSTRPRTDSNATAPSSNQLSKRDNKKAREARERTLEASPAPSSNGKGLKRTLTDFRIESLEISALDWLWKAMPLSHILARMNLKEKKELQSLREASMGVKGEDAGEPMASTSTQLPSVAEESEKPSTDEAKAESPKTAEVTIAPSPEADAANQAVSAEMQKSDSRPEKRKHARDEDEPEDESRYGLPTGEAASDEGDHPVGKKVKSEAQQTQDTTAEPAVPPSETEPASNAEIMRSETSAETEDTGKPTVDDSMQQAQESNDDDGEAQEELPATADNSALRDDEVSSEASSSADEVAATFIASKSPSKQDTLVEDYEVSVSRAQLEADDADSIAGTSIRPDDDDAELDEGLRSRRDTSQLPDDISLRDAPKKLRENSRLRIYFMSPVELEQKEIRQSLLKPKTPSALSQSQLASADAKAEPATTSADLPEGEAGPDQTEAQKGEKTNEGDDRPKAKVEAAVDGPKPGQDDLDGEPLAEKATEEEDKPEDKSLAVEKDAAAPVPEVKVEETEPSDELAPGDLKQAEEAKQGEAESTPLPVPSPDRLSIAYAQNTRRLVVDAQVVDEVAIHRADGKIEITVRAVVPEKAQDDSRSFRALHGIYVEKALITGEYSYEEIGYESLVGTWGLDESSKPKEMADGSDLSGDHLTPPLHYLVPSSEALQGEEATAKRFTIVARLDRANPLTEAKWVRTGTPDEWMLSCIREMGLSSTVGRTAQQQQQQHPKGEQGSNNANASTSTSTNPLLSNWRDAKGSAWKGKIRVVDPDAPPTFHHALENWLSSTNSRSGFDEARYRFVNTHFQDIDNVLEVLLRLIRGSAAPDQQQSSRDSHRLSSSTNNAGGNGGVSGGNQTAAFAVQALASGAPYAEQQTPISLASFQLFKMGIEAAISAGTPKAEVDRKVGEIVRSLPYSLIFRSLDSMFVDFKRQSKA